MGDLLHVPAFLVMSVFVMVVFLMFMSVSINLIIFAFTGVGLPPFEGAVCAAGLVNAYISHMERMKDL